MILNSRMPNMPRETPLKYNNIYDILKNTSIINSNINSNINIYFGSEDIVDVYQLSQILEYPEIKIFPVKYSPHNVMHTFNEIGHLKKLINSFIYNKEFKFTYVEETLFFDKKLVSNISIAVDLYYNKKDYNKALEYLNIINNKNLLWGGFYSFIGLIYDKLHVIEKSEKYFLKALIFFPYSEYIYMQLGLLNIKYKKFKEAEECFLRSIKYAPAVTDIHLNKLGIALMLQNKLNKSLEIQYQALEKSDVNSEIYYQIGLLYFKLGNYIEALHNYKKSYELNPSKENTIKHIRTTKKYLLLSCFKEIGCSSKDEMIDFIEDII